MRRLGTSHSQASNITSCASSTASVVRLATIWESIASSISRVIGPDSAPIRGGLEGGGLESGGLGGVAALWKG